MFSKAGQSICATSILSCLSLTQCFCKGTYLVHTCTVSACTVSCMCKCVCVLEREREKKEYGLIKSVSPFCQFGHLRHNLFFSLQIFLLQKLQKDNIQKKRQPILTVGKITAKMLPIRLRVRFIYYLSTPDLFASVFFSLRIPLKRNLFLYFFYSIR